MPLISVMMPARNAAATIGRALQSTLRALPGDAEVIVFDDASDDKTLQVAGAVKDSRVRFIRSHRCVGSGSARRLMMDASDSEYIANVDADDVCLPGHFSLGIRALETSEMVFGTSIRFTDPLKRVYPTMPTGLRSLECLIALVWHNPFCHSSLVARRVSVCRAGGYQDLRSAQDYELWLRAAALGTSMRRLPNPTIAYRLSQTQISAGAMYSRRVSTDSVLTGAYEQHVRGVARNLGTAPIRDPSDRDEIRRAFQSWALRMRPANRFYYSRLAVRGFPDVLTHK